LYLYIKGNSYFFPCQEQQVTEKLVSQLDAEGQRKFNGLQLNTTKLDKKADELQAQLDEMNSKTKELEFKINQSDVMTNKIFKINNYSINI